MIESLAKIISHFPEAANRACCTAHIVNLVSKIILRQFNARKKTIGAKKTLENVNDKAEPDEGGDCIVEVAKKVKPIQRVLFKVRFNYSY